MVYGYVRISTAKQSNERQIRNILEKYESAKIVQEIFSGTTIERKEYIKLKKSLKKGDTIVFDSVSRMSRNSDEGVKDYKELLERGINLVFLKERYIDTEIFNEQIRANESIKTNDVDLDETIMNGIRKYLTRIAEKQIVIAFEQSEKEVQDLKKRTREGLKTAKINGKQIGRETGRKYESKKSVEVKKKMKKYSKSFDGSMSDKELIEDVLKIDRNTYYKYKKEMLQEVE